jgi:hypothetical protein
MKNAITVQSAAGFAPFKTSLFRMENRSGTTAASSVLPVCSGARRRPYNAEKKHLDMKDIIIRKSSCLMF